MKSIMRWDVYPNLEANNVHEEKQQQKYHKNYKNFGSYRNEIEPVDN